VSTSGLIFRKEHVDLILRREKTQTRRRHRRTLKAGRIYSIKTSWTDVTDHRIKIDRVFRQRLGDMTAEEALKEGGYTVEKFKRVWGRIVGPWDPDEVVTVYEFHLVEE